MSDFPLTEERARQLCGGDVIAVHRADGTLVGWRKPNSRFVIPLENPFTEEEIREAERSLNDPNTTWHTTAEVLAHLRSLGD